MRDPRKHMKIFIETLGCPKNTVDSEYAAGILENSGHRIAEDISEADIILINTCAFIQDAKEESIETILSAAEYIKGKDKILVVTGCLGERYQRELFDEIPEAHIIVGVNHYEELPGMIAEFQINNRRILSKETHKQERQGRQEQLGQIGKPVQMNQEYLEIAPRKYQKPLYRAYLRISEGCDNRCTYCVIPSIRGQFRSRRLENILSEAQRLSEAGCREITIVAQDVTNYGIDLYGTYMLPSLLEKLCGIDGIRWIRLMYCYSDKITDELIDTIARNEKICHYIDIPIQHASDPILKAMGRKSTRASTTATLEKLRDKIPDMHIRTTLITGFPGESDEDFQKLLTFVNEMKFERLGVFAYSKEENTPAGRMKNQVRKETKLKRRDKIMAMQREISLQINQSKVGSIIEVLIEEALETEGLYLGRSQYDALEIDNAVMVNAGIPLEIGQFVMVKITDAYDYDLVGTLV